MLYSHVSFSVIELLMVAGNSKFAQGLQIYLLSRDHSCLKSEFQLGRGKVRFGLPVKKKKNGSTLVRVGQSQLNV